MPTAVREKLDGVYGSRPTGPFADAIHEGERLFLEGHRNIDAASASRLKRIQRAREVVLGRQQLAVLDILSGLPCKGGVNLRRAAVRDRIANDRVTIRHATPPPKIFCKKK